MAIFPERTVFALKGVELRLETGEHPWVKLEKQAIEANWARDQEERPWLFNGTILLHRVLSFDDGVIRGISHRAPYAALRYLVRTWPGADVCHLFGSAIIVSSDGAVLLIRMAARTANSGKVYAPSGSLDNSDVVGDVVDLDGSIRREAGEETGIDLSPIPAEEVLYCWRDGGMVAVFRRFFVPEPADAIAERMRDFIVDAPEQEVDAIVVVRSLADVGETVPLHVRAMLEFHFAGQ